MQLNCFPVDSGMSASHASRSLSTGGRPSLKSLVRYKSVRVRVYKKRGAAEQWIKSWSQTSSARTAGEDWRAARQRASQRQAVRQDAQPAGAAAGAGRMTWPAFREPERELAEGGSEKCRQSGPAQSRMRSAADLRLLDAPRETRCSKRRSAPEPTSTIQTFAPFDLPPAIEAVTENRQLVSRDRRRRPQPELNRATSLPLASMSS